MCISVKPNVPFDAVIWMRQHGRPGYAKRIYRFQKVIRLALIHNRRGIGAAAKRVAVLEARIEEIRRDAWERYDDWRSDPLD